MFLIICLILALAVGVVVALLLFWEHRHLCSRNPYPDPQEPQTSEQTFDIIYGEVDPPPPYAPTMDGGYTLHEDWIEDLRDALDLASAPQEHPSTPPPSGVRANPGDTQELEEQDQTGELQSSQHSHRPHGKRR